MAKKPASKKAERKASAEFLITSLSDKQLLNKVKNDLTEEWVAKIGEKKAYAMLDAIIEDALTQVHGGGSRNYKIRQELCLVSGLKPFEDLQEKLFSWLRDYEESRLAKSKHLTSKTVQLNFANSEDHTSVALLAKKNKQLCVKAQRALASRPQYVDGGQWRADFRSMHYFDLANNPSFTDPQAQLSLIESVFREPNYIGQYAPLTALIKKHDLTNAIERRLIEVGLTGESATYCTEDEIIGPLAKHGNLRSRDIIEQLIPNFKRQLKNNARNTGNEMIKELLEMDDTRIGRKLDQARVDFDFGAPAPA